MAKLPLSIPSDIQGVKDVASLILKFLTSYFERGVWQRYDPAVLPRER
jgi:hypothetical protein